MSEKKVNMNIEAMISEYNKRNEECENMLKAIFYAIKKRKGNRKVVLSSGNNWSNCWDFPDNLDEKLVFYQFRRKITEYFIGE